MSPKKGPDPPDGPGWPATQHDPSLPDAVDARVADVLYLDLVAYSKLAADEQSNLLTKLQNIVQEQFSGDRAAKCEKIVLQIGDGIAVVFFNMPEAPALLGLRLAAALKSNNMAARIGVFSGPVIRILDLTGRPNVAGPGINMAQRVMAFGDAGHILVSGKVADDLRGIKNEWNSYLKDLGSHVVKHGSEIQIFNLCAGSVGNPAFPSRLKRPAISAVDRIAKSGKITKAGIAAISTVSAALVYAAFTRTPPPPDFVSYVKLTDAAGQALYPSISPNGKLLIYASKPSENWDIYSQKLVDDSTLDPAVNPLTEDSGADNTQPAFSKDGGHIAFRSERDGGGIFIMNAAGGVPQLLTKEGYNPSWAPEGDRIVVGSESIVRPDDRVNPKSALWVIRRSQAGAPWIRDKEPIYPGDAVQPAWSPNGFRIAFWSVDKGQRDIMTISAVGGEAAKVTDDSAVDWNPVWSPDGKYIYFSSDRSGNMNLWRIAIDERSGKKRGEPEPVAKSGADISHVSFSGPNKLVFVQRNLKSNIHRKRFDPLAEKTVGASEPITEGSKQASRLDLSPDNNWLAFTSVRGNQEEIFVINSEGEELSRVADESRTDRNPRWSPDGKRIAFFSKRSGNWQVWIANRERKLLKQITGKNKEEETGGVVYPVWSPHGNQIAYTIIAKEKTQPVIANISAANVLEAKQPLPPLPPTEKGQSFTAWSWSPDGHWLAGYQQRDEVFSGITIYSIAGKSYRKLTNKGSDPVWLRDSRRLLFHHEGKIFIAHIDVPGKPKEVLRAPPHDIARRGFGITRDDQYIYFSKVEAEADVWLATPHTKEQVKTITTASR